MDPITLVVTALAAGVTTGLSGTASQAITDAYGALKRLLRGRLSERGEDPEVVDAPETEPERWRSRLAGRVSGADIDADICAAAQQVLAAADPAGTKAGKYVVTVSDSKGVVVGDRNIVNQTIS